MKENNINPKYLPKIRKISSKLNSSKKINYNEKIFLPKLNKKRLSSNLKYENNQTIDNENSIENKEIKINQGFH